jgi:hypothetical protein
MVSGISTGLSSGTTAMVALVTNGCALTTSSCHKASAQHDLALHSLSFLVILQLNSSSGMGHILPEH